MGGALRAHMVSHNIIMPQLYLYVKLIKMANHFIHYVNGISGHGFPGAVFGALKSSRTNCMR